MLKMKSYKLLLGVAAIGVSAPALAQQTEAPGTADTTASSNDIVVTAVRRRNESVQETPLAVTALPGQLLQDRFITDLTQVGKLAPNLQISRNVSTSDVAAVYLRGFGTFGADLATEPKVAIFVDGIYQPAAIGSTLDTFDVSQIEVQAGPQGTLLGKNAPIGAIYVTSEKPTGKFGGVAQAEYTNLDASAVRAKVNFPILADADGNSILSGRVSGVRKDGGNWVKNLFTGKDEFGGSEETAVRGSLRFNPGDRLVWDVSGYYLAGRSPQGGNRNVSNSPIVVGDRNTVAQPLAAICLIVTPNCGATPYGTVNASYNRKPKGDYFQASSTLSYKLDPVTATIVAGHVQYKRRDNQDVDGSPASIIDAVDSNRSKFDQQSLELRFNSNKGGGLDLGGLVDWVIGGFVSTMNYNTENRLAIVSPSPTEGFNNFGPANILQAQEGKNKSQALFAQVIVNATEKLSGTFGVRRSYDQKSHRFSPPTEFGTFFSSGRLKTHDTSFEAGASYKFDSARMVYFRYAQGYTTGGFVGFPATRDGFGTYLPQTNEAFEIGVKSEWFDRKLRININAFRNKLNDLQVAGTRAIAVAPFYQQQTTNSGSAIVKGIEAQFALRPTPAFDIYSNVGYLDTKYNTYLGTVCSNVIGVSVDCSGVPFAYAPKWTVDSGATYTLDVGNEGKIRLNVNYSYKDDYYTADAPVPSSFQKAYGLLGASVAFMPDGGRYTIEAFGLNLTNKKYIANSTGVQGLLASQTDGRPIEGGVRVTYRFGN